MSDGIVAVLGIGLVAVMIGWIIYLVRRDDLRLALWIFLPACLAMQASAYFFDNVSTNPGLTIGFTINLNPDGKINVVAVILMIVMNICVFTGFAIGLIFFRRLRRFMFESPVEKKARLAADRRSSDT